MNLKIIDILKSLSSDELKEFEKYLNSPYFHKERNLIPAFTYLKKFHPDYENKNLTKQKLANAAGIKGDFNNKTEQVLRTISSDLVKCARDFLMMKGQINFPVFSKISLLRELQIRKLDGIWDNEYDKICRSMDENASMDESYLENRSYLEVEKMHHSLGINQFSDYVKSYQAYIENNTYTYLIKLLKAAIQYRIHKNNFNVYHDFNIVQLMLDKVDVDGILSELKHHNPEIYKLLSMYNYLNKFDITLEKDYYYNFRNIFYDNINKIAFTEKTNLFYNLEACCTKLLNSGFDIRVELLDVYKRMLKSDSYCYTPGGQLPLSTYRNIVLTSKNDTEFLRQFIDEYHKLTGMNYEANALYYGNAVLNFVNKNYNDSLRMLAMIRFDIPIFKIDVKNITAMIYYENGDIENLYYLIDTYRHYLKNTDEISENYKNSNLNFTGYLLKLAKGDDREELDILKSKLKKETHFFYKDWLIDIIDEMELVK